MNDVNIVKFKSPTASINKDNSYLFLFVHLLFVFIFIEIYFLVKFIYVKINYNNLYQYIDLYNTTLYTQVFVVLSVNVEK